MGGVEHLSGVETLVHRHELVAKRITGRVQRHGQTHRDALGRELPDAGHDADGRYGDVTRGDAEPFGRHRADLAHGGQHGPVVAHRLAHAHEHDVAEPAGASGHFAVAHHTSGDAHLFQDLAGRHVAGESKLAGRAERTAHAAADLAGDA